MVSLLRAAPAASLPCAILPLRRTIADFLRLSEHTENAIVVVAAANLGTTAPPFVIPSVRYSQGRRGLRKSPR